MGHERPFTVCLQTVFILVPSPAICAPSAAAFVPACDLLSMSQFGLTTHFYLHAAFSCAALSPGRASDFLGIACSLLARLYSVPDPFSQRAYSNTLCIYPVIPEERV